MEAAIGVPATARANIKPQRGIWVVYAEPRGDSRIFIARKFFAGAMFALDADEELEAGSIEDIRALLPDGLINVGRNEEDPACVVETWV